MSRLRFLEIYIDLGPATRFDFDILSFLMSSLYISLTSPATLEHLGFNIQFGVIRNFDFNTFCESLGYPWSQLDSITTHPAGSRLQRVDINISYAFLYDEEGEKPDDDRVLKAVLDGLPLLRAKGILFLKAIVGE